MAEDEGGTGMPHFALTMCHGGIPLVQRRSTMLQRENKSLASAILDIGEQMKKMEQMLQDSCKKYAPINNPQSEVETRI